MSKLILYRGDSDLIEVFKLRKTSKQSLVGRGIYLTDSQRVADTYRVKQTSFYPGLVSSTLFNGLADNKLEAFEKALIKFNEIKNLKKTSLNSIKTSDLKTFINYLNSIQTKENQNKNIPLAVRQEFNQLVNEGQIRHRRIVEYKDSKQRYRHSIIFKNVFKEFGNVSKFEFEKTYLENNILNISHVTDIEEMRLVYECVGKQSRNDFDYFLKSRWFHGYWNLEPRFAEIDFNKLSQSLAEYGYIGFEYTGGRFIGGHGYHRAFSIWDEEYVNNHKVD